MRDTYEEGQIYQRRIDALQEERDGVRHDYLDAMAQLDQETQECVALAFERDALRTENAELKQQVSGLQDAYDCSTKTELLRREQLDELKQRCAKTTELLEASILKATQ